ncbi:hypothetical protein FA95DRAFT_982297 [Auriscalpium vulgare]|uniref:Uncharacterized protein n=1 Tax=Auriscalpium vulgare TaxID=40419 RepID=A0ACB8R7E5_9AGAM|nr:hypothetical protein FA95DRAFT_982297 [Auriscalpium vulgare]
MLRYTDDSFFTKNPVDFVPNGGTQSNTVTLRLSAQDLGPLDGSASILIANNVAGAMTRAGCPLLEPACVGEVFRVKTFRTEAACERWVADYNVLRDALQPHGIVRVPGFVLPGTLTVTARGGRVVWHAALVQWIPGKRVSVLDERAPQAAQSPLGEVVRALRAFRVAMRERGISFGGLRPKHFVLPLDLATYRGGGYYDAFQRCVVLVNWDGMTCVNGPQAEKEQEKRYRKDFDALEEVATIMAKYL